MVIIATKMAEITRDLMDSSGGPGQAKTPRCAGYMYGVKALLGRMIFSQKDPHKMFKTLDETYIAFTTPFTSTQRTC